MESGPVEDTDQQAEAGPEAGEELFPILFAGRPPSPLFEVAETAQLISDAGLPRETAATQIRRFAQQGWLHVRGHRRSGPTAANLFGPTEVVIAKVLSVLTDLGIADRGTLAAVASELRPATEPDPGRGTLAAASLGMTAWRQGHQKPTAPDPTFAAILGMLKHGQSWDFRLDLLRDEQAGHRHVRAFVYDTATEPPQAGGSGTGEAENLVLRATVTIPLRPLVLRIFAARGEDR
jgi:hypothetical protein